MEQKSKFVVGDKVVRIEEYWACYDGGFMEKGKEYVVKSVLNDREIKLEGSDMDYSISYFELVEPTFKNMKFRVSSPEQSKEIQEVLFELGYVWKSYGNKEMFTECADTYDWLYTNQDGCIWLGNNSYRGVISAQEFIVETTKSYKLIPVEPTKETITIDGKTYDKEAVLKRLAELDTLE